MPARDPEDLFDIDPDRPDVTGAVFIHALDGFIDAGSVVEIARANLLDGGAAGSQVIARFDVDQLHDYRARRAPMQFDGDHWASYAAPQLAVHLLHDDDGVPYLLLAGPEPDVQWERYIDAVRIVVERLQIRLTVGMNAFPMSVPHTRPTPVILHGSRPELIEGYRPWLGGVAVPASAGHLIEYRLGQAGLDAMGVATPVPPYLSAGEYPAASLAMLREVGARTGLRLPLTRLEDAAVASRAAIDAEVAKSDEVKLMVAALEQQYDAYSWTSGDSLLSSGDALPSADELGAELERFLADRGRREGPAAG